MCTLCAQCVLVCLWYAQFAQYLHSMNSVHSTLYVLTSLEGEGWKTLTVGHCVHTLSTVLFYVQTTWNKCPLQQFLAELQVFKRDEAGSQRIITDFDGHFKI